MTSTTDATSNIEGTEAAKERTDPSGAGIACAMGNPEDATLDMLRRATVTWLGIVIAASVLSCVNDRLVGVEGGPDAVADLEAVNVTPTSVTLEWTEVDDGEGNPAKYVVRWGSPTISLDTLFNPLTDAQMDGTSIGTKRSHTFAGLAPATYYEFGVIPYRGELTTARVFGVPDSTSATTLSALGTITDLAASAGNTQLSLSWTAAVNATSQQPQYRSIGVGSFTNFGSALSGTATSAVVTGLTNGTAYELRVVASNASATTNSNVVSATPNSVLGTITNLTANVGNGQVTLSWTSAASATTQQPQFRPTGSGVFANFGPVLSGTATSVSVTGLTNGTTYDFRVVASDGISTTNSNVVSATPNAPPAGASEPVYSSATDHLIDSETFDGFDSFSSGSSPFLTKYRRGRAIYPGFTGNPDFLGPDTDRMESDGILTMVTGRGGSGRALQERYGGSNGAEDLLAGPMQIGAAGSLGGGVPEAGGPFTTFFFSTWFRTSPGANPSAFNQSSVKGFMFWYLDEAGRFEVRPTHLRYGGSRWDGTHGDNGTARWQPGGGYPENSFTGLDHWKTADGLPPSWVPYNDGNWHRITFEIRSGSIPNNEKGWRMWLDGTLMFDNVGEAPQVSNLYGRGVGLDWTGNPFTGGMQYPHSLPTGGWSVWGNYVNTDAARGSPQFTIAFDDWTAWTRK